MSATSAIEWTDRTWNPVRGCSIVSPGCVNCYAMKQAHRFSGPGKPYEGLTKLTKAGPQWTGKVRTIDAALLEPLSWRKPARVFVNSMSDLFHEAVPDEFIDRVFAVMALAPQHTFQVLTKRPQRMRAYMDGLSRYPAGHCWEGALRSFRVFGAQDKLTGVNLPLPNVWLGVSVEDQQRADERIPLLLETQAAVRFLSCEPLLGPVTLGPWLLSEHGRRHIGAEPGLSWVIVGGESGPGARPFDVAWARGLVSQCRADGVPVFMKQLGSVPVMDAETWHRMADVGPVPVLSVKNARRQAVNGGQSLILAQEDRKGGDMAEWPSDLRVREFPR